MLNKINFDSAQYQNQMENLNNDDGFLSCWFLFLRGICV